MFKALFLDGAECCFLFYFGYIFLRFGLHDIELIDEIQLIIDLENIADFLTKN